MLTGSNSNKQNCVKYGGKFYKKVGKSWTSAPSNNCNEDCNYVNFEDL